LVKIVQDFGFDGYLLNVENKVSDGLKLVEFMTKLNRKLKDANPFHILIHYDSVLIDGSLKWQDELNQHNRLRFIQIIYYF
jgi:mannosyl-glycoprotein endo-beta-N-acetylglucosaminidase